MTADALAGLREECARAIYEAAPLHQIGLRGLTPIPFDDLKPGQQTNLLNQADAAIALIRPAVLREAGAALRASDNEIASDVREFAERHAIPNFTEAVWRDAMVRAASKLVALAAAEEGRGG